MTSQTELPSSPLHSVRAGGGELRREVAALDPFLYQEMRWCAQREELQPFVFMCESATRRAGVCLGCGEYGEERFSRTVSEECVA
jgi:hypothetical protein